MNIYRQYCTKDLYLASVLYDSIEDNNISAVKSLIVERNANPNILLPRKGISAFHLAIGSDSPKFALEVTTIILHYGGNPNIRSIDGLTPVHIAAAWGRIEILHLLLNCGGDPHLRDASYMNAIDYAIEHEHVEIAAHLKEKYPYNDSSVLSDKDEISHCDIVLDKILINNGLTVGEYQVTEVQNSVQTSTLQQLPKTNTEEYVRNWIGNTIISDSAEKYNMKHDNDLIAHTDSEDSDPKNSRYTNVTHRRRYRKESCSKKGSPVKCLPIEENLNNTLDSSTRRRKKKVVHHKELSRESGILTLPESSFDISQFKSCVLTESAIEDIPCSIVEVKLNSAGNSMLSGTKAKDTTSDYCTCTEISENSNILERNIFEISSDKSSQSPCKNSILTEDRSMVLSSGKSRSKDKASDVEQTFVSVSEVYKYMDADEGVVLYEKRLLVTPTKNLNETILSTLSTQSSAGSLPQTFDYDTDTLRKELTQNGFQPGPITKTTKRIYLKKLYKLKKYPRIAVAQEDNKREYSRELERTIKNPEWESDLSPYKDLDLIVSNQFSSPDPTRKWREGVNKSSFNYLLLDPRITQNLPCRADTLTKKELWETFLSAIFYVGKGKRSRPYAHLYEAVSVWNQGCMKSKNKKLQHILDIWSSSSGVICLHVFQNVIPVEAYTREAAMISAIRLENLKNVKAGDFYGQACTWSQNEKRMLGVYLLLRAMNILLQEGERQLSPTDID